MSGQRGGPEGGRGGQSSKRGPGEGGQEVGSQGRRWRAYAQALLLLPRPKTGWQVPVLAQGAGTGPPPKATTLFLSFLLAPRLSTPYKRHASLFPARFSPPPPHQRVSTRRAGTELHSPHRWLPGAADSASSVGATPSR